MKQVYDEYYRIFSCNKTNKNCECPKKEDPCENTPEFCYEIADCNDCIIERVGLSEAYVPYQTDFDIMETDESLVLGTTFKNLVIPYKKTSHKMGRCC